MSVLGGQTDWKEERSQEQGERERKRWGEGGKGDVNGRRRGRGGSEGQKRAQEKVRRSRPWSVHCFPSPVLLVLHILCRLVFRTLRFSHKEGSLVFNFLKTAYTGLFLPCSQDLSEVTKPKICLVPCRRVDADLTTANEGSYGHEG